MEDIIYVNIDLVKEYEKNNKNHTEEVVEKLANSINEFGWTYPILVDENKVILAGHKRLLAAKKLELKEVPILVKKDLTETQKKAYRIIDNVSSEESSWNFRNLEVEIPKIIEENFNFDNFINLDFFNLRETEINEDDLNSFLGDEISKKEEKTITCPQCGAVFKK